MHNTALRDQGVVIMYVHSRQGLLDSDSMITLGKSFAVL